MEHTPIENRPIQGVTPKTLAWFFGGIIAVIMSVMTSAFMIKSDVRDISRDISDIHTKIVELQKLGETRDLKIENIQTEIKNLQLEIALLKQQLKDK